MDARTRARNDAAVAGAKGQGAIGRLQHSADDALEDATAGLAHELAVGQRLARAAGAAGQRAGRDPGRPAAGRREVRRKMGAGRLRNMDSLQRQCSSIAGPQHGCMTR